MYGFDQNLETVPKFLLPDLTRLPVKIQRSIALSNVYIV
jgi:hypothetical protein